MSVAGLSRLSRSASSIVAKAANGFHLLRVDGYSQTKTVLPGQKLSSQEFAVGGHSWRIDYYPNGRDASAKSSRAISLYLQLVDRHQQLLQAKYKFSLLDHGGHAAYELPAETGTFASVLEDDDPYDSDPYSDQDDGDEGGTIERGSVEPGPGCGHEEFIGWDELERREHLIRDDSIVFRCDVGVTQTEESWLAHEEPDFSEGGEDSDEEGYEATGFGGHVHRRRRRRRADDVEYVKWCLAKRPGGRRR